MTKTIHEYLTIFSSRCFHLRYSVLESPTSLITLNECFLSEKGSVLDSGILRKKEADNPLFLLIDAGIHAGGGAVPLIMSLKVHVIYDILIQCLLCAQNFTRC